MPPSMGRLLFARKKRSPSRFPCPRLRDAPIRIRLASRFSPRCSRMVGNEARVATPRLLSPTPGPTIRSGLTAIVWSTSPDTTVSVWATTRMFRSRLRPGRMARALPASSVEPFCRPHSLNRSCRKRTRRSSANVGAGISPIITRFASRTSLSAWLPSRICGSFSRICCRSSVISAGPGTGGGHTMCLLHRRGSCLLFRRHPRPQGSITNRDRPCQSE